MIATQIVKGPKLQKNKKKNNKQDKQVSRSIKP